jgi:hypothetical protein
MALKVKFYYHTVWKEHARNGWLQKIIYPFDYSLVMCGAYDRLGLAVIKARTQI